MPRILRIATILTTPTLIAMGASLMLFARSAQAQGTSSVNATVQVRVCGNGSIESPEECDGSALNSQTCTTLGYVSGTLTCDIACDFDTSGCTNTSSSPSPSPSATPSSSSTTSDTTTATTTSPSPSPITTRRLPTLTSFISDPIRDFFNIFLNSEDEPTTSVSSPTDINQVATLSGQLASTTPTNLNIWQQLLQGVDWFFTTIFTGIHNVLTSIWNWFQSLW